MSEHTEIQKAPVQHSPADEQELSDDQLESAAGGATSNPSCSIPILSDPIEPTFPTGPTDQYKI